MFTINLCFIEKECSKYVLKRLDFGSLLYPYLIKSQFFFSQLVTQVAKSLVEPVIFMEKVFLFLGHCHTKDELLMSKDKGRENPSGKTFVCWRKINIK